MSIDWTSTETLTWLVPVVATVAFLVISHVMGRREKINERIDRVTGKKQSNSNEPVVPTFSQFAKQMSKVGEVVQPKSDEERTKLRSQMIRAGYYHPQAGYIYLAVKALGTFIPLIAAGVCMVAFPAYSKFAVWIGVPATLAGALGPVKFLKGKIKSRQLAFHKALPDAMDLAVVCLEGGLALTAALQRVADSLGTAHPELGFEMSIVDRSIQMGRKPGEALRELGERVDMEELRTLGGVVGETERLGGSMAASLRNLAEAFREERTLKAEVVAQQAAVKILMPTALFIFPCILIVVLGPVVARFVD